MCWSNLALFCRERISVFPCFSAVNAAYNLHPEAWHAHVAAPSHNRPCLLLTTRTPTIPLSSRTHTYPCNLRRLPCHEYPAILRSRRHRGAMTRMPQSKFPIHHDRQIEHRIPAFPVTRTTLFFKIILPIKAIPPLPPATMPRSACRRANCSSPAMPTIPRQRPASQTGPVGALMSLLHRNHKENNAAMAL